MPAGISGRLVVMLVGAQLALPVYAQDLAALAKKERERRAKITKPARVFVDGDSKDAAAGSQSGGTSSTPPPPVPTGNSAGDQKAWKARADEAGAAIAAAERDLAASEKELAEFQADLKVLTGQEAQDPMRLQKRDAALRQLVTQRDARKVAVASAKGVMTDLEQEARRTGVPPGWLRE